jgi:flavodoxin
MNTLIICISIHHGNTEKIAKAMAEVLNAEIIKPNEVDTNELSKYDLIGFGSGIYFGKHHKSLLNLADKLPIMKNKKAFIFSTSGMKQGGLFNRFDRALKEKLIERGFNIIGNFSCLGFDTSGPFKFIGGIAKGRPNEKDLEKARNFACELLEKSSKVCGI